MEQVGQAHNYSLNRDRLLAGPVLEIARARDEFAERIREFVDDWREKPEVMILFGSAARGQMRSDSDIDLFVAGQGDVAWDDQLTDLEQAVHRWTGDDARVLVMGPDEVDAALGVEPFLIDIAREGQVLWGPAGWLRDRHRHGRVVPSDR